jgi:hypothetical protein
VDDDVWFRPKEPLGWPLAWMGFSVGLFAVDLGETLRFALRTLCLPSLGSLVASGDLNTGECLVMASFCALSFGIAGRWVAANLVRGVSPIREMLLAVFAAGQAAGSAIGVLSFGGSWAQCMLVGLICSLVVAPFASLLAHNGGWAWRARAGSLLHASYRRARWIDAATAISVTLALYAQPVFGTGGHVHGHTRAIIATTLVFVAASVAAAMAVVALSALLRLRAVGARFRGCGDGSAERERDAEIFDVGIGDERRHHLIAAASAYRHQDAVAAVCVGDMARAWRVVALAVGRSLAVVALGVLVLGTRFRFDWPFGACG